MKTSYLPKRKDSLSPCEKYQCKNYDHCKVELTACRAFGYFVEHGKSPYSLFIQGANPSKEIYKTIFGPEKSQF